MNSLPDHVETLITRFPRLFKQQEPQLGITTGAGWNPLLIDLFEKIDRMLDDAQAALFAVEQIKGKFGGLRVYYAVEGSSEMALDLISPDGVMTMRTRPQSDGGFPRQAADQLIAEATARARVTCERCACPGKLRQAGWIHVIATGAKRRGQAQREHHLGALLSPSRNLRTYGGQGCGMTREASTYESSPVPGL